MTIANKLTELKQVKADIKTAIQDNLGQDLTNIPFTEYHNYIVSSGGTPSPKLTVTYPEQDEYVIGESVTFSGTTMTPDGSTALKGVQITYNGSVVATSDDSGAWTYTTTWPSDGCLFQVIDNTYGVLAETLAYPGFKFVDSFAHLSDKISALGVGETLELTCNYRYLDTDTGTSGISLATDNIIITSQGTIIDAQNNTRIFQITGTNITLEGLTLQNATTSGEHGACILIDAGDNHRIIDCTFQDNTISNAYGGGIYNKESNSILIQGCEFLNNQGTGAYGPGFYNKDGSDVRIINCLFQSNTTSNGFGAAIYNKIGPSMRIKGSYFISNSGTGFGGAIFTQAAQDLNIHGCLFHKNSCSGSGGAIGAQMASNLNVQYSIFTNNTANTGADFYNMLGSNNCLDDCYWGENSFNSNKAYNGTVNRYLTVNVATENLFSKDYIKTEIKSSANDHRFSLDGFTVYTTIEGTSENSTNLDAGLTRVQYTKPSTTPYTVTVQLETGEVITKSFS